MRQAGHAQTWSSFTWQVRDQPVTTIAPGLDRRHHFANAYLVGYVPFPEVEAWVPLAALAQRKRYQFDHEQYPGAPELWQTSREAFFHPRGDCEDHALALADWLIGLGHDARVVIGTMRGGGHAWVVLLDGEAALFVERGGRSLVPLREPDPTWLRPALSALVAHVRAGGAKRLAVERFDGTAVAETEVMQLLVEAGFLAGPRRAVLRP